MKNTNMDALNQQVSIQYIYKENLFDLCENYYGATKRIHTLHNKISDKPEIASEIDKYIQEQVDNGNYVEIDIEDARKENQLHFVGYNFVVSANSSSTKVRMTTDSSMQTETGLSLNKVTQPAPGDITSLRGILMQSRCHPHYAVYNIKEFFRSVRTSDQDSYLRIVCIPSDLFSNPPTPTPSWRFFRDRAVPFGNSASGDYATCAKVATVQTFIQDSPADLQPAILQAVLEDTYIDDGGVRATSAYQISVLQNKIGKILGKGGFHIKSWECSGEDKASKYLGMTWNRLHDSYILKFRLNPQPSQEIPQHSLRS